MAIIKDITKIQPVIETVKTIQAINNQTAVAAPVVEDGWSRFERIITGINQLAENFVKLKTIDTGAGGQAGQSMHLLTDGDNGARSADVHFARDRKDLPANTDKGNNKMNVVMQQLMKALADHVEKCAKENPNMTLGECIDKIPVNVTQIKVMLDLAKTQIRS